MRRQITESMPSPQNLQDTDHGLQMRLRNSELGSEDLHFSPASFSAQNFGKFSSDHHETPSSSIVANKDDLESQGDDLSKSLGSHASKNRFYR